MQTVPIVTTLSHLRALHDVVVVVVSQFQWLYCYITRTTLYFLMLLYWFTTGNTEVKLVVTDSTEHAFNM